MEQTDSPDNFQSFETLQSANKKKSKLSKFQPFAIIFGISILSFVLYKVGFKTVVETISRIGWGFFVIVALNGLKHIIRALGLFFSVPNRQNSFTFYDAITIRLAGEAVGVLTFTGAMASETTKTALLKKKLTLSDGLATIVVDNLLYNISLLSVIFTGCLLMLFTFAKGNTFLISVLASISFLMFLGLFGLFLLVVYRFKPMTFLLKKHSEKNWFPKFIKNRENYFTELEDDVLSFYENHRKKFYLLMSMNFSVHLVSAVEVYIALYLLGFIPLITTSYIIESLTKVVNIAFSFIPGNLGISEGGAAIIFLTLGYASATGVALALVRRGATLFWTFIGLLILISRGVVNLSRKPA
jgi:uncharacterized membrane protein YbhN (UPF0104 family)